jgi:hypothetical protein
MDEFTESSQAVQKVDATGNWQPVALAGNYVRKTAGSSVGVTGKWWFCDGQTIHPIQWTPPEGAFPHKTFSTVYSAGYGFWILNGDATNPSPSESWHRLWFDWDETTLASSLTNAGTQATLRVQDVNARWPRMLLPDIYHGPHYSASNYGGLRGDLAIFLSLIAFSMRPDRLAAELPRLMTEGSWKTHSRSHGRTWHSSCLDWVLVAKQSIGIDKRGVIVYIYAYNNNGAELRALEDGGLGNYYS